MDEQSEPEVDGAAGMRRRRGTAPVLAGLGGLAVVLVLAVALRQPAPRPDGRVILYGDSVSVGAAGAYADELAATTDAEVEIRAVPAAAPCDARSGMEEDRALEPDVVVIQFVGNNVTACTRGPGGAERTGADLVAAYEADVRALTEMWAEAGARVVLVGGPDAPGLPGGASLGIADAYERIVNEWAGRDIGRVRYADAAATVTSEDHTFTERLPCRGDEGPEAGCADGQVVVRAPDRIHFCPAPDDSLACPVPAPGAARFGAEMARVTALALDPGY